MTGRPPRWDDPTWPPPQAPTGPTHWPSLLDDELADAHDVLRAWVEQLAHRFTLDINVLPPCWELHNATVETLAALRDHERASYSSAASATAALEWIHAVHAVEALLRTRAARAQCTIAEHHPDAQHTTTIVTLAHLDRAQRVHDGMDSFVR